MAFLTEEVGQYVLSTAGSPAPTFDVDDKKFGASSIVFSGSNYVHRWYSGLTLTSTDWTIDYWVKPASLTASQVHMCNRDNGGDNWFICKASDNLRFGIGGWLGPYAAMTYLSTSTWNHVAVVKKSTTFRMFINGTLRHTLVDSITLDSTDRQLIIGYGYDTGSFRYFTGKMDEIRFSNVALWEESFTPPISPTVTPAASTLFLTHFDEPQFAVSGSTTEDARILIFNESDWALEKSEDVSSGSYNISTSDGTKTIIAVPDDTSKNGVIYRGVEAASV